jgi:peptidoglycan/LPS O-acetylase OafA/YrhL
MPPDWTSTSVDACCPNPGQRLDSLTGLRGLAALLVVGTHAAYGTGAENGSYVGLIFSRWEIGVTIFFVLSGFLLFTPWVNAAATGAAWPELGRYFGRRTQRIMPAYVVTVLIAYLVYQLHPLEPNPGHTWTGLWRHLTLTQTYTRDYMQSYLHQGLTQTWSLAAEVAFYLGLPLLACGLLTVLCQRRWRPILLLVGLGALAAISPTWLLLQHITDWLPSAAGMWLPSNLAWFVGGMMLAVLRAMGVRCYAFAAIPVALIIFFIVSTPIAGAPTVAPTLWQVLAKHVCYAVIAILVVAPLALGDAGWYARLMSSRTAVWLGEISYEVFLLHVIVMWVAMSFVLGWKPFTGSTAVLMVTSLVVTIPLAWLLQRLTRRKARFAKQIDFCQDPPGWHPIDQSVTVVAPRARGKLELATTRR